MSSSKFTGLHDPQPNPLDSPNVSVIKCLFSLAPTSSSRESRSLLSAAPSLSLGSLFNRVLSSTRLSNFELHHFLSIILKSPSLGVDLLSLTPPLDLNLLVSLKFPSQDKHSYLAILSYFSLTDLLFDSFSHQQRLELFHRLIFVFHHHVSLDPGLYSFFVRFLRNGFLDIFLFRRLYLSFPFLNEFVIDFLHLGSPLVKVAYDSPSIRPLLISLLSCSSSLPVDPFDWLVLHWKLPIRYSISQSFFRYDIKLNIENVAAKRFAVVGDVLEIIKTDLNSAKNVNQLDCECCAGKNDNISQIERLTNLMKEKEQNEEFVFKFNKTGKLAPNTDMRRVRLARNINLKVLGRFLCDASNYNLLAEYTSTFNFAKIDLLECLRLFLGSFVLSGESQAIERVVRSFANKYVRQNDIEEPEPFVKLVYSLIVLNTMLHNPSVEKRPTLDEYLVLVDGSSKIVNFVESGMLAEYYESIKTNEIKMADEWRDSYDLYLLYSGKSSQVVDNGIYTQPVLCKSCVLAAYHILFNTAYQSYLFLDPAGFYQVCEILGHELLYIPYMKNCKGSAAKEIVAYSIFIANYIANYDELGCEVVDRFVMLLKNSERSRSFGFGGFKSFFSTTRADSSEATFYEKIRSSTVATLSDAICTVADLKFKSAEISAINYPLLAQSCSKHSSPFIIDLFIKITLNNSKLIDDLSFLEFKVLKKIYKAEAEMINYVDDKTKIALLKAKGAYGNSSYNECERKAFESIQVCDEETFQLFCEIHKGESLLASAVCVNRNEISVAETDLLPASEPTVAFLNTSMFDNLKFNWSDDFEFTFIEKYSEPLLKPDNAIRLMVSFSSLANRRETRDILNGTCPFKLVIMDEFKALAYLLYKLIVLKGEPSVLNYIKGVILELIEYPLFLHYFVLYALPLVQDPEAREIACVAASSCQATMPVLANLEKCNVRTLLCCGRLGYERECGAPESVEGAKQVVLSVHSRLGLQCKDESSKIMEL